MKRTYKDIVYKNFTKEVSDEVEDILKHEFEVEKKTVKSITVSVAKDDERFKYNTHSWKYRITTTHEFGDD